MTRQAEQPTVVIDMGAEEAPPEKSASRLPVALALLTLLLVLVAAALGYFYWHNLQQDLARMSATVDATVQMQQQLQQSIEQAQAALTAQQKLQQDQAGNTSQQLDALADYEQAFKQQSDLLAAEHNRMQQREVELRAVIADLRNRLGKPDARWMVAEAEYLLQLAIQRLQLADDAGTALAALQQADQRLQETKDDQWLMVRHRLAADMAALEQVQPPDIGGLLGKMDALGSRFSALRPRLVAGERSDRQPPATSPATEDAAPSLHGLGQALWKGLARSVRIRRHDQPVASLLTTGQEAILVQNARLLLETARLALVQKDQNLYQNSLQRLSDWLQRYFHLDGASGQQVVNDLHALQALNLKPAYPDLTLALEALRSRKALNQSREDR
ncbi:uroporphyrinogen-III C-methyltransferase [Thiolapillus sp.]